MPFSIKRFTIHRSSSLPTHGGPRDKKDVEDPHPQPPQQQPPPQPKQHGGRALKKSASQDERTSSKPKHSSRARGLPSSQSVDTADLRRMNYALDGTQLSDERELPPLPPHDIPRLQQPLAPSPFDYRFQPPSYGPPPPHHVLDRNLPPPPPPSHNNVPTRWRGSGAKERRTPYPPPPDPRTTTYYEQGPGGELRRLSLKKNGVRFQDSDLGTEESQSTSSSSGGGGGGGGGGSVRGDYWDEPKYPPKDNSRWGNGRRGNRSVVGGGGGGRIEWPPEESNSNGPFVRTGGKRSQQQQLLQQQQQQQQQQLQRRQQQQHHGGPEPAVVQDSRPRLPEFEVGYRNLPPNVYDEDPGIMSEVETSSTGLRRSSNKVRQNLPQNAVRTPSKSQDRPLGPVSPQLRQENLTLGLVFLQYRSETKRALLPNEITTLDTVKALFVRSFPKQLTMEYLDSPHIRIYIHDPAKDMFYELEDLRDIRDRSVLRIYEQDINGEGIYSTWEQELSYFSEPEFDSEYQNQHIHRAKKNPGGYYGVTGYSPVGRSQTLPPGTSLRAFSPLPPEHHHHHPTRPPKPPAPPPHAVAYAQTLPWGTHIVTYATGPPSSPPDKRPKEILIPTGLMQPPPKPQRSFQQQSGIAVGKIRSTPPPAGPPPSIPSPRSGMSRPPTMERRHEPQGAYRPERPYSVGAQPIYPGAAERLYEPAATASYHSHTVVRPGYETTGGGYLSSPERRYDPPQRTFVAAAAPPPPPTYPPMVAAPQPPGPPQPLSVPVPAAISAYEEPYYGERIYAPSRSGSVTPVVDEEARIRVEYMERQLASLTGLVQKALSTPPPSSTPTSHSHSRGDLSRERSAEEYGEPRSKSSSITSLSDDCHESHHAEMSRHAFKEEKSVSFSDETTTVSCSPVLKQHSPQHGSASDRPVKPAIKSSLLRTPSTETDSIPTQLHPPTVKITSAERAERESRSKPAPPPKPASLAESTRSTQSPPTRELRLSPELYGHLRHLKKQTKDLKLEVRNLRRIAQAQALTAKETVRETCLKIKTMLAAAQLGEEHVCAERLKVSREEDLYRQDVNHLEKDLLDLESQVEELRGNVINRKCRVSLGDVEGMALILSRASKAVADLKARFPALQESLKTIMAVEMEVVVREEKFIKDEPDRLENALRRCKKLTGTLVTLKRLASVQEQRHTVGHHLPEKAHSADGPYSDGEVHSAKELVNGPLTGNTSYGRNGTIRVSNSLDGHTVIHVPPDGHQMVRRGEGTALDALLSELQTFNLPVEQKREFIPGLLGPQKRLPSYPSADSPVRSPIHGYPGAKSPEPKTSGNKLTVPSAKSLSPTPPQNIPERKLSPTAAIEAAVRRLSPSSLKPSSALLIESAAAAVKKVPPPPPPRTTSRSPITSPTASVTTAKQHAQREPTMTLTGTSSRSQTLLSHLRSSSVPPPRPLMGNRPTLRQTASSSSAMVSRVSISRDEPPVREGAGDHVIRTSAIQDDEDSAPRDQLSSNSSSSESVNSQEGIQAALQAAKLEQTRKAAVAQLRGASHSAPVSSGSGNESSGSTDTLKKPRNRQELLEHRHQELLRKQKQLQEQYSRLQQMQRGQVFNRGDLKKTGSESNILSKAALSLAHTSGSMQHLAISGSFSNPIAGTTSTNSTPNTPALSPNASSKLQQNATSKLQQNATPNSKVFETDIL